MIWRFYRKLWHQAEADRRAADLALREAHDDLHDLERMLLAWRPRNRVLQEQLRRARDEQGPITG